MNINDKKENFKTKFSISMKDIHKHNKEFFFDMDVNKYFIKSENDNKLYESNLFGKKKAKINIPQTGFAKYNDRIMTNSIEKLSFKIDDSLYHPQSLRFEGYSQYPRPLIIPFSNIVHTKLQKNLKKDLLKTEGIFTTIKNKNILNKKPNKGLYFYTGTINNLVNTKNRESVLNKINDTISYENKNKLNKHNELREFEKNALKKFRKKILSNSTNIVFGRKLKKPDEKFFHQYIINYNIYFNNPIKKNKLKKTDTETESNAKFNLDELYRILNKKRVQNRLNLLKKEMNLKLKESNKDNSNNDNHDNNNDNHKDGDNNSRSKIKEKIMNHISKSIDIENIENKNNKNFFDAILSNKNKFNSIEYESKAKYNDFLFDKNEENNNMEDKKGELNNNLGIRTFYDLDKKCLLEKKSLVGFNKPKIKNAYYRKYVPKYKSSINIYKKEWDLYKVVNPIKYKLDEEKELKEFKLFQDKLKKEKEILSMNMSKSRKNKCFSSSNIFL